MEDLLVVLYSLPFWVYIVDAFALGLALFFTTVLLISRVRLSNYLKKAARGQTEVQSLTKDYSLRQLSWHSKLIEKKSGETGVNLPSLLGLDSFWVEELEKKRSRTLFLRVLKWAPEKGLFLCFVDSLGSRIKSEAFLSWMKTNSKPMKTLADIIAEAAEYRIFPGKEGWALLSGYSKELKSLSEDTNPAVRFFSLQILIHDEDPHSRKTAFRAFSDPDSRIRVSIKCLCFSRMKALQ